MILSYLVAVVSSLLGNLQGEDIPILVPGGPFSGWVGGSVILSVNVSPPISVISYVVHWQRLNSLDEPNIILFSENHQIFSSPGKDYNGRTYFIGNLYEGDVSMQMINLTVEDNGNYICSVESPHKWKINITINLTVKAMGSIPVLSFSDAADSGLVNVTCESDGWYPEPTVIWTNNKGKVLSDKSNGVFRGNNSLINVSSWVLVSPSDYEWVSCSVGLSDHDRTESRVRPHTHTDIRDQWKLPVIVLSVVLVLSFMVALILYKKGIMQCSGNRNITQDVNEATPLTESRPLLCHTETDQNAEVNEISHRGTTLRHHDNKKSWYHSI